MSPLKALFFVEAVGRDASFEGLLSAMLKRGHEVLLAVEYRKGGLAADETGHLDGLRGRYVGFDYLQLPPRTDLWRIPASAIRRALDYLRYLGPEYTDEDPLPARARERSPRALRALLFLPPFRWRVGQRLLGWLLRRLEAGMPIPRSIRSFISEQSSDVVLVSPLVEFGSAQGDYLRAAQSARVPSVLVVAGSDDLTSKGVIRDVPTLTLARSDAQVEEAVGVHGLPRDAVMTADVDDGAVELIERAASSEVVGKPQGRFLRPILWLLTPVLAIALPFLRPRATVRAVRKAVRRLRKRLQRWMKDARKRRVQASKDARRRRAQASKGARRRRAQASKGARRQRAQASKRAAVSGRWIKRRLRKAAKPSLIRRLFKSDDQLTQRRDEFFSRAEGHTRYLGSEAGEALFIVKTADKDIGRSLFAKQGRGEHLVLDRAVATIEGLLGPDAVADRAFVDVGANIGTTTIPAILSHGFGSAVAIEPEPENVRVLRANVALNDLEERVVALPIAVSNAVGRSELLVHRSRGGKHSIVTDRSAVKEHPSANESTILSVPTETLDHLVEQQTIEPDRTGMLWMDAEGHEGHILEGASALLARGIPLVLEWNPSSLARAGGRDKVERAVAEHYTHFASMHRDPDPDKPRFTLRSADRLHAYADSLLEGSSEMTKTDILVLRLGRGEAAAITDFDRIVKRTPVEDADDEIPEPARSTKVRPARWRAPLRRRTGASDNEPGERTSNNERDQRTSFFDRAGAHTPYLATASGGAVFLVQTEDKHISRSLYAKQTRGEHLVLDRAVATIQGLLGPGAVAHRTFIDVGANIGTTTIPAILSHGFDSAVAIEPESENVRVLRANVALNDLEERVVALPVAVSNAVGQSELVVDRERAGKHWIATDRSKLNRKAEASKTVVRVETVTLDYLADGALIEPERTGLLWMDAEGHEGHILEGASSLLTRGTPLVVEWNPVILHRVGDPSKLHSAVAGNYTHFAGMHVNHDPGEPDFALQTVDRLPAYAESFLDSSSGRSMKTDILALRLEPRQAARIRDFGAIVQPPANTLARLRRRVHRGRSRLRAR